MFIELRKTVGHSLFYLSEAMKLELPSAVGSQLLHCVTFEIGKPKQQFESAMLIFSVDKVDILECPLN